MRVILAGGGTAGHINPALAIADTIKRHYPKSDFLFVGTKEGMESTLVPKAGYKIEYIKVSGFKRKVTPGNLVSVLRAARACLKCRKIIKDFDPDIVIGTGGYVSGPLLYTAVSMKIPTLIHEQNVFAGMTSKMLGSKVDTVCISFEKSRKSFEKARNVVLTGNPLRSELFNMTHEEARRKLGLDSRPFLVTFGGSLGAGKINEIMVRYIKSSDPDKCRILFATGNREYETVMSELRGIHKDGFDVVNYIYNMDQVMQAADLLVCRAGAITVSELNALGKPAVLIPSPNVTDNHQYYNAKALSDNNAAVLIEEKNLEFESFSETVNNLLVNTGKLSEMGANSAKMGIKNATELILKEIEKII